MFAIDPARIDSDELDQLRVLVEHAPVGLALFDPELRYLRVNRMMADLNDLAPEAHIGRSLREIAPEVAEVVEAPFRRVLQTGEPIYGLETARHHKGTWLKDVHPIRGADGRVAALVVSVREITAQKRAEEHLARLAAIVETSEDAIVSTTPDGILVSWNRSAERLFGYAAEEVLGSSIDLIVPKDRRAQRRRAIEKLERGERVAHFESERLTSAGRRIPVSVGYAGIRDAAGRLVGIAASDRDISLRRRAEEITAARAREQEAVAALGQAALAGKPVPALMEQAVQSVVHNLKVDFCKLLELSPDGQHLLLRAGVGWPPGLVGRATLRPGLESQAGYTLSIGQPVIVRDLRTEDRFAGPRLHQEQGVVSGASVVIAGEGNQPYGVISAHSRQPRAFTTEDVHFLQLIANVLADAIQRTRAEAALRRERELLQGIMDTIPVMIVLYRPDSKVLQLNPAFERFTGWSNEDARKIDLMAACYPDPAYREEVQAFMTSLEEGWRDLEMTTKSGRVLQTSWANIRLSDETHVGIGIDVSERKLAEERQELLLAELSHRVKNILATVQSIAQQSVTGERTLEQAREAFVSRLRALAHTHDLLTAAAWQGASLHRLVEAELEPYGARAALSGADLLLKPRVVQTLGLVLHELATNAAKYGALSRAKGRVEVRVEIAGEQLRLTWRERGGPKVGTPGPPGFGRRLIERAVTYDLGGEVRVAFEPAGVTCEITAAVGEVAADGADALP